MILPTAAELGDFWQVTKPPAKGQLLRIKIGPRNYVYVRAQTEREFRAEQARRKR